MKVTIKQNLNAKTMITVDVLAIDQVCVKVGYVPLSSALHVEFLPTYIHSTVITDCTKLR